MLSTFFDERFGTHGFLNEKLWLGNTGQFLTVFAFTAALLSCIAYFAAEFAQQPETKKGWKKIARTAFAGQALAVLGIFVLLFVMILNHMFEYHYAWRHSSTDLPLKYIISSFWEGQEGSFLLWMFWLAALGTVALLTLKDYESPVLGTIMLTQVFLGSMVLGITVLGHKIGSNPFILLRDEMANAPIFQMPDYLSRIKDGNGLNPLLQNYWMTIHPPVLFCGFASVTFPFAFAIAALLRKDWNGWVKHALPWTLFSVAVLGTGILMGGAWAYESLSFGGFWAWDPVENMSFVPWLMVVAGLHMLLVYRYTRHSIASTFVFFILGFGMVLYSTFLTRSGILGDTSVHAFTDLGMSGHLLLYMAFFVVLGFTLLLIRMFKRQLPTRDKEEELFTREFWMFIGTLVLLLSAVQMTFTTSTPVWNKLFNLKVAPPLNVVEHYNNIQIWMAIVVALLTGAIQFLAYKSGKIPRSGRWAVYSLLIAAVLAVAISWAIGGFSNTDEVTLAGASGGTYAVISGLSRFLFLLASLYAVVGNLVYLLVVVKGNINSLGGSVAHFGFGLFLVGTLISQGKKDVISLNRQGIDFGGQFDSKEKRDNILLLRDSTLQMGDYQVTYNGVDEQKPNNFYLVNYVRHNKAGQVAENFVLRPNAQLNPKMGLLANPDTKHYLTKDVFTHVSSLPDNTRLLDTVMTAELSARDTFAAHRSLVYVEDVTMTPEIPADVDARGKIIFGLNVKVITGDKNVYDAHPLYVIDTANGRNSVSSVPYNVEKAGLTVDVGNINPSTKKITLSVREREKPSDFIILKAIVFPYINLVWLGGIITFIGALISMLRRIAQGRRKVQ